MDQKTLIESISAEHPDVPTNKVKAIVRAAFESLRAELEKAEPGKVATPLGNVGVAMKERKAKSGEGTEMRRTYSLRLAKSSEAAKAGKSPEQQAKREEKRAERKAQKAAAKA
jgi:nucleoid DNA-binding protein